MSAWRCCNAEICACCIPISLAVLGGGSTSGGVACLPWIGRPSHYVRRAVNGLSIARFKWLDKLFGRGMEGTDARFIPAAARLVRLRQEHRDLDAAIEALRATPAPDQLQIARLKKRKLRLKDEIAQLEDQMIADTIA